MKKLAPMLMAVGLVLASVGLSSCGGGGGGGGKEGGVLKGDYTSFPDYMDPQISYTAEGWTAMQNVYIPLLTYQHAEGEEGSEVIPGLAKELPKISNGGKTYTLFLRKGLKYSNGEAVKASDFRFAVERMFKTNSGGSPFYTVIEGAEKFAETKSGGIPGIKTFDNTGEIVINLTEPSGTFVNELALMFVAPVPQGTPEEDQSHSPPPATGPYEIVKSQPGRGWTYERNPYWAKNNSKLMPDLPSGHVDKIEIKVVRNESTEVNEVEQGKINWMFDPPPPDRYAEVQEKYEGTQFRVEPTISTYYFWMNNKQPPFNDLKVRQALNYAIDPRALERIYSGQLKGTQQILPPGMPGYEKFELYPHDMGKAKKLIEEANPSDRNITVWTDQESPNNDAGTYEADVLKKLGFNVELKQLNPDNYFTIIGNQSTPNLDTGFADWFEDFPHPTDFFEILLNGSSILKLNNENFSLTEIPELDKKMNKLATEQLGPKQEKEYAELDKAYMEEAVWAPYGNRTLSTFVSSDINLDNIIWNPTFEDDLTSFEFK
jgi:peptide/nickel transport system substrate-binding protein